jgi:hypothetical protein
MFLRTEVGRGVPFLPQRISPLVSPKIKGVEATTHRPENGSHWLESGGNRTPIAEHRQQKNLSEKKMRT